ncbi:MAG: oxidoreductase [Micromonosporaceae bacterium]|nr:oxidoreductase [Micromonosporaceae bacterium]
MTEADPLAPLLDLEGVSDALAEARAAVDDALRHRALRRQGGPLAAETALRAAQASAALEGHDYPADEIRGGAVTDPVVQGALRVTEAAPRLADSWGRAPSQVLARLHVLAARGLASDPDLGRPSGSHLPASEVSARLDGLARLVAGSADAPALLLAAVVHGELLAVRPFAAANGVVARAAARLTLIDRGLDPRALIVVEAGHLERQPEYTGAAGACATGTPDGLRSWLKHYAAAVVIGAGETVSIADRVLAG